MAALLVAGCAAPPAARTRVTPPVRAVDHTIHAVMERPLVVPLALTPGREPPASVRVSFGGSAQQVPLFWVQIDRERIPTRGEEAAQIAARWMQSRDRWSIAPPLHAMRPGARGFLAILVSPAGGREAEFLEIEGARHPVVRLPARAPALPPLREAPQSAVWDAAMRLLHDDPLQRWKSDLFRAPEVTPYVGRRTDDEDPLLSALAHQAAARWRFGLAQLGRADAELAGRIAAHLGGAVDFGEGVVAPCRQSDPLGEEGLLRDLIAPRLSDADRVVAARAWLAARRKTLVWVMDDAGGAEATEPGVAATVSIANVDGVAIAASAAENGHAGGADLSTVDPGARATLAVSLAAETAGRAGDAAPGLVGTVARGGTPDRSARARLARAGREISLRAAGTAFTRRAYTMPALATPPGAPIGPLVTEWTMVRLIAHAGAARHDAAAGTAYTPVPTDDRLTVGMVYHEAGSRADAGGWVIYLECGAPPGAAPDTPETTPARGPREMRDAPGGDADEHDAVRLWFGPFGAPNAVLRIGRDGVVIDETHAPTRSAPRGVAGLPGIGRDVRIVREGDRWMIWAGVPETGIEDGILLLGVERTHALPDAGDGGARTTWPRPVLPWQREPGRAAIDLTAWDDLGM